MLDLTPEQRKIAKQFEADLIAEVEESFRLTEVARAVADLIVGESARGSLAWDAAMMRAQGHDCYAALAETPDGGWEATLIMRHTFRLPVPLEYVQITVKVA